MQTFIQNSILWTLALYGMLEIIKSIIYIYTYKGKKLNGIHIILAVKNQENNIEGFLRSLIFKILYGKEEMIREIIVTDLNSTDKTKDILIRLSEDYECVKFMDFSDIEEIFVNV